LLADCLSFKFTAKQILQNKRQADFCLQVQFHKIKPNSKKAQQLLKHHYGV